MRDGKKLFASLDDVYMVSQTRASCRCFDYRRRGVDGTRAHQFASGQDAGVGTGAEWYPPALKRSPEQPEWFKPDAIVWRGDEEFPVHSARGSSARGIHWSHRFRGWAHLGGKTRQHEVLFSTDLGGPGRPLLAQTTFGSLLLLLLARRLLAQSTFGPVDFWLRPFLANIQTFWMVTEK